MTQLSFCYIPRKASRVESFSAIANWYTPTFPTFKDFSFLTTPLDAKLPISQYMYTLTIVYYTYTYRYIDARMRRERSAAPRENWEARSVRRSSKYPLPRVTYWHDYRCPLLLYIRGVEWGRAGRQSANRPCSSTPFEIPIGEIYTRGRPRDREEGK